MQKPEVRYFAMRYRFGLLVCGFLTVLPQALGQNVANGGFENGDFSGCWVVGGLGQVEVLQASNFSPAITPTQGTRFALLSTGPNDPDTPVGDIDGNGTNEYNSSTLSITFAVSTAPVMLCFDWLFLTDEIGQPLTFDDIFRVTLNGGIILSGSVRHPGGISPYPDTAAYNGVSYNVNSTGATDNSNFDSGRTNFSNFCTTINTNGLYTLQFLVADQGDRVMDSGLLIDNLTVTAQCVDTSITQITNSSGSNLELKNGGFAFTVQSNDSVAASDNGQVLAFVSSGNYLGGNPNLRRQLYTYTGGTFARITANTNGHVGHPALTSNGRWLVFEYSGNPLGTNADGNIEIFRYDRTNGSLVQVTNTTGGSNTFPSVSNDGSGRRVSFLSNSTHLTTGDSFNLDGNKEVVIWDANTGNYFYNGTSGCTNVGPEISQNTQGRYVSFTSSCNYTGGNADGNLEVFQWDRQNNNYTQVTNSSNAAGDFNDVVTSNDSGQFLAFVSNANYGGQNPAKNIVVYRYNRGGAGTITRIVASSATLLYTNVDIDDSGSNLGIERFNVNTGEFDILHYNVGSAALSLLASGNASFPAVGVNNGVANVAFQSDGNYSGNNPDANLEIWSAIVD